MMFRTCKGLALLILLAATFLSTPALAQMMASERSQVHQMINGMEVVIDYSRPSVRGRSPIWGGIEPWGTVWTPGANHSSTFKFSKDVKLNGTDIAAGKYSVWFELLKDEPWNLLLMRDTTLFHVPYPSRDSAFVFIPIHPQTAPSLVETLRFDFENVRVDGADIQFRWGDTLVPIRLDVDPGYDMVFTAEEAAPYTGDWLLDSSMDRPPDSLIAVWRSETPADQLEMFEGWMATYDAPAEVRMVYDEATGHLVGYNEVWAKLMKQPVDAPVFALIRRAEGIFVEGNVMDGELMDVLDYFMWEFEYDADGKAEEFVQRQTRDDKIIGKGVRADN